jgi:hypothetical protein
MAVIAFAIWTSRGHASARIGAAFAAGLCAAAVGGSATVIAHKSRMAQDFGQGFMR